MRALLAALTCHKGDIWRNVSDHLVALDAARHAACDVAIFPELSLTGSVDALRHPDRAVAVDDAAVRTIVDTTRNADVAVVFGIAERDGVVRMADRIHGSGERELREDRDVAPGAAGRVERDEVILEVAPDVALVARERGEQRAHAVVRRGG